MSELVGVESAEEIPQIYIPVSYDKEALAKNLALLGATPQTVEETSLLFGTYDTVEPDTLGHVDAKSNTIVLYAGAIEDLSGEITANKNPAWTSLAKEDELSTAFNITAAFSTARLALHSASAEQNRKKLERQHNIDERLQATSLVLALGAAGVGEWVGYVNHYGQILTGAAGAAIALTAGLGLHTTRKVNRAVKTVRQDNIHENRAIEFSTTSQAARLFGEARVIQVDDQHIAPVVEIRPGITNNSPAAS